MLGLSVLPIALIAGQAVASAVDVRSPLSALLRRQSTIDTSDIPPQCQTDCKAITAALGDSTCYTDVNCICGSSAGNGFYTCLECALNLAPDPALLAQAQDSYDEYVSTCRAEGASTPSKTLTLPDGSSGTGNGRTSFSDEPTSTVRSAGGVTRTGAPSPTNTLANDDTGVDWDEDEDEDQGTTGSSGSSNSNGGGDGSQQQAGTAGRNGAGVAAAVSSVGLAGVVGALTVVLAL